jgi:HEAT repeat protein
VQNKSEVDDILKALESESPETKISAMFKVVEQKVGEKFVNTIAGLLEDKDGAVRTSAIKVLGLLKAAEYKEKVARFLKGDTLPNYYKGGSPQTIKGHAAMSLARMGAKEYVKEIIPLLESTGYPDSSDVRSRIVWSIARLHANDHAKTISHFLDHKDGKVRGSAAMALALLGEKKYAGKIAELLSAPEAAGYAALALGELGAVEYEDEIADLLNSENKYLAIDALGTLKSKKHLKRIGEFLYAGDQNMAVCGYAAEAIRKIDPTGYDKVFKTLSDDNTRIWVYDEENKPRRIDTTVGETIRAILWEDHYRSNNGEAPFWTRQSWAQEGLLFKKEGEFIVITGTGIVRNIEDREIARDFAERRSWDNVQECINRLTKRVRQICIDGLSDIAMVDVNKSLGEATGSRFTSRTMPNYRRLWSYFDHDSVTQFQSGTVRIKTDDFKEVFRHAIIPYVGESKYNMDKIESVLDDALNSFFKDK